jgi:hypothetical protein
MMEMMLPGPMPAILPALIGGHRPLIGPAGGA